MAKSRKSRSDKIRDMRDRPRTDPYAVLGVPREATADEVKSAYRELAQRHHPDKCGGSREAEEKFKEVGEAYDVLSDDFKRSYFDKYGVEGAPRKVGRRSSPVTSVVPDEDEKERQVFVGNYGGAAHYHLGRPTKCTVCGFGFVRGEKVVGGGFSPPRRGCDTLPGVFFIKAGAR